MNYASYTLKEAQAICEHYQYLTGKRLFPGKEWTVACVAVAPADRLSQWLFAHFYLELGCPEAALNFYRDHDYDVIVLSVHDEKHEVIAFKDIRHFLETYREPPLTVIPFRPAVPPDTTGRMVVQDAKDEKGTFI